MVEQNLLQEISSPERQRLLRRLIFILGFAQEVPYHIPLQATVKLRKQAKPLPLNLLLHVGLELRHRLLHVHIHTMGFDASHGIQARDGDLGVVSPEPLVTRDLVLQNMV